jgi:hypothetical protein
VFGAKVLRTPLFYWSFALIIKQEWSAEMDTPIVNNPIIRERITALREAMR